jgi:hypothetical protein
MTADLAWAEPARELERQPDTRKDNGAMETALEAHRVPGNSGTCTVVLDRADVSEYTLTPHAATPRPSRYPQPPSRRGPP